MKRLGLLLLGLSLLLTAPGWAEPDELVRDLLGITSIPAKFTVPEGATCGLVTYANFKDGAFQAFGPLDWNSDIPNKADLPGGNYEIEFGVTRKDDRWGVLAVTSDAQFPFHPDDFLSFIQGKSIIPDARILDAQIATSHLSVRWSAAHGGAATGRIKDFYVLGYACMGTGQTPDGMPLRGSSDIQEVIKSQASVTVFLFCPFKSESDRNAFSHLLGPDYWK